MENGITLLGLNKNYEIVCVLAYSNLQWSRKWHECGTFSVSIPLSQYSKNIYYVYTKDRPEMGKVNQVNYFIKNNVKSVQLSGYFLEKELDKMAVYPLATKTNITNQPTWSVKSAKAETVAYAYFDAFKSISFTKNGSTVTKSLGIRTGNNSNRGHDCEHQRINDNLGNKIYKILKPSHLSYRVTYDLLTSVQTFSVVAGKDLTQSNVDLNNPVVFSTKYGNINDINYLMSDTNYKNSFVVTSEQKNEDVTNMYVYADTDISTDNTFIINSSSSSLTSFSTENEFINSLYADGKNKLDNCTKKVSVQFKAMQGSYEYRKDFDIGDICNIEIPELQLSLTAILTACYEVIKKGVWSMTTDFELIN